MNSLPISASSIFFSSSILVSPNHRACPAHTNNIRMLICFQDLAKTAVIKKTVSHGDISSLHIEVRWPHLKSFGLLICGFFGSIITQVIFSSIIHCFMHGFGEEAEVIRQDIMLHDMYGRYVVVGARDRRVQEDSVMLNLPHSVASALVLLLVTKCVCLIFRPSH